MMHRELFERISASYIFERDNSIAIIERNVCAHLARIELSRLLMNKFTVLMQYGAGEL